MVKNKEKQLNMLLFVKRNNVSAANTATEAFVETESEREEQWCSEKQLHVGGLAFQLDGKSALTHRSGNPA